MVLGPMRGAQPAEAKDYEAMKAEKEARKKALREAAVEIKSTGKDVAQVAEAFKLRVVVCTHT